MQAASVYTTVLRCVQYDASKQELDKAIKSSNSKTATGPRVAACKAAVTKKKALYEESSKAVIANLKAGTDGVDLLLKDVSVMQTVGTRFPRTKLESCFTEEYPQRGSELEKRYAKVWEVYRSMVHAKDRLQAAQAVWTETQKDAGPAEDVIMMQSIESIAAALCTNAPADREAPVTVDVHVQRHNEGGVTGVAAASAMAAAASAYKDSVQAWEAAVQTVVEDGYCVFIRAFRFRNTERSAPGGVQRPSSLLEQVIPTVTPGGLQFPDVPVLYSSLAAARIKWHQISTPMLQQMLDVFTEGYTRRPLLLVRTRALLATITINWQSGVCLEVKCDM